MDTRLAVDTRKFITACVEWKVGRHDMISVDSILTEFTNDDPPVKISHDDIVVIICKKNLFLERVQYALSKAVGNKGKKWHPKDL